MTRSSKLTRPGGRAWSYLLLLCALSLDARTLRAQVGAAPVVQPVTIDLPEAIRRAQANEPLFVATAAESRAAKLDRGIARAALLPSVVYHNQFLFTQSNGALAASRQTGVQSGPVFIANNAVHEYASQGLGTETIGLRQIADVRLADAAAARAVAELEITRRGLVATVVGLYVATTAGDRRLAVAQRALDEATSFTDLTQKREAAREVAHADVVKAQLQGQSRQRDLVEAQLLADRSRLELGVLLFPDPRTPYQTVALPAPAVLPTREEVEQAAAADNPELRSAFATLRQSDADVLAARSAYLPDLTLQVAYGIDAPQFSSTGPGGLRNRGYAASATLDIPIWDWLSTERRVKQSTIRRDAVRVALTAAQRRTIAALNEAYAEAVAAQAQERSLDESVTTARESLRLTKLRYASGEATVLEVVDAQTALSLSETASVDGASRVQAAFANLQTLTGHL